MYFVRDNRLGYFRDDQISRQEKQFSKLYIIDNYCTSMFYKHFGCSLCPHAQTKNMNTTLSSKIMVPISTKLYCFTSHKQTIS